MLSYRREIDGLRALAVVPVLLFHAKFGFFSGGFVGVDVFFVISGYLITSIILNELQHEKFSFLSFYERRARRILPALFVVMLACTVLACLWMMPDELKNFGQSLVATTLISNNVLLAITSGYWKLASEFKPLLHTWSLGVEEQYYLIFPVLLVLAWKRIKTNIFTVMSIAFALSLVLSQYAVDRYPFVTFYALPTRAWELLLGAMAAVYLNNKGALPGNMAVKQFSSFAGMLLIVGSIALFDEATPTPSLYALIPTVGAILIILYATEGTIAHRLLGNRGMVAIGLISYSLYLWHQPLFAFARIYLQSPPSQALYSALIAVAFLLAYGSWRLIETPFRKKTAIKGSVFWSLTVIFISGYIAFGLYLNQSYGMASRVFDDSVKISEMDKRAYNSRVFSLKQDAFQNPDKLKVLVTGDSFARDFVNMITETYTTRGMEIVYRDDVSECIVPFKNATTKTLYEQADVIVIAGSLITECVPNNLHFAKEHQKPIFYAGTKQFGYNLNWLSRLEGDQLKNRTNEVLPDIVAYDKKNAQLIPPDQYLSFLATTTPDGRIPITDEAGRMLSSDRSHLTRYGAIYFGRHVLGTSKLGSILMASEDHQ
jgi:peptidoglycan/LPS O-acetylase OafA/YrhL